MKLVIKMYRKTYMKINLDHIGYNIKTILNQYANYDYYFGVVKANCYNHDKIIIQELIANGINYLAVSSLEEAIDIRKYNQEIPILCLQPIALEYIDEIINHDITITVNDYAYYQKLCTLDFSETIKVHIKLNTGMNRLGIHSSRELQEIVQGLLEHKHILLEGIYSHLATADNNDALYEQQKETFLTLLSHIPTNQIPIIHLFNSAALLKFDKLEICNGTRLGLIMYGINPVYQENPIALKPVISLYSEIMQINHVKKGEFVGYGANYIAEQDCDIAIIPIGYADGFIRKNQGRYVCIHNHKYQIVGRICMDMTMILVDKQCQVGDVVTLIGKNITIEEVAEHLETITWEVICSINDRVTKLFTKKDNVIYEVNHRNHHYLSYQ